MIKNIIILAVILIFMTNGVSANHIYQMDKNFNLQAGVFAQLQNVTINGITAEQAVANALQKASEEAKHALEHAYDDEEYNQQINRYNYLAKLHKDLCNITSRTSYTIHSNIFDFIKVGNSYIHWLPFGASEETCQHYSYDEMMRHAEIYNELLTLYYSIIEKKRTLQNNKEAERPAIYRRYVSEALAPYTDVIIKEYEQKAAEYNSGKKHYKCISCKGRCHLNVGFNKYDLVGFICDCGHAEFTHKFQ